LRTAAQTKIDSFFGEVHLEVSKLLKATSDLLAEVTDLPAVVVGPSVGADLVRAVHVVSLSADQVLVVVVTEGGRVFQQRARVRQPVTPLEVEDAQRLVSATVVGQALHEAPAVDVGQLGELSNPTREAVLSVTDALHLVAAGGTEFYVGGTQRMGSVFDDISAVQQILEVLEREAEVMKMLAGASGTSIQIGSELPVDDVDIAIVSSTYDVGSAGGSVGVIGPMRMNYKRAITAVEEVTRELEDQIGTSQD